MWRPESACEVGKEWWISVWGGLYSRVGCAPLVLHVEVRPMIPSMVPLANGRPLPIGPLVARLLLVLCVIAAPAGAGQRGGVFDDDDGRAGPPAARPGPSKNDAVRGEA